MVEAPDGTIYNILRFNTRPTMLGNYAVSLKYDLRANQLTSVLSLALVAVNQSC